MLRLKAADLKKAPMRDPPTILGSLVRLGVGLGLYSALVYWMAHHFDPVVVVISAVLIAPLTTPLVVPGVLGLAPAFFRWASTHHLEPWQGHYFEYEGRHIRIFEEGGSVFVVLSDIVQVAQLRISDREMADIGEGHFIAFGTPPRRAIRDQALLSVLGRRTYPQALAVRLWLERQVLPSLYRKRAGELVPQRFGSRTGDST